MPQTLATTLGINIVLKYQGKKNYNIPPPHPDDIEAVLKGQGDEIVQMTGIFLKKNLNW
jgi:hypothetical protein